MDGDLVRFQVYKEVEKDPIYGKSKALTGLLELYDEAVEIAASYNDIDVYVVARTYTCKRNLERDFALSTEWVWSPYYSEEQQAALYQEYTNINK